MTSSSPAACSATSAGSPSGSQAPAGAVSSWTRHEEKLFEKALAVHDQDAPDRWEKVAAMVPGKDMTAVKRHYDLLVEDVNCIESGQVLLPLYSSLSLPTLEGTREPIVGSGESPYVKNGVGVSSGQCSGVSNGSSGNSGSGKGASSKTSEQERRKGIPWTEEEHRTFKVSCTDCVTIAQLSRLLIYCWLFLLGLEKFGKGDWRSISRNFVVSRTPTQVASHAQKYFIRLNSMNKDRRRSSIHDITSANNNGDINQPCQGPITGQGTVGQPLPHPSTPSVAGGALYGASVGQPIAGSVGSAVCTPVLLPSPGVAGPYIARGPLVRPVLPGAPPGVVPMAYPLSQQPVPQTAVHRQ